MNRYARLAAITGLALLGSHVAAQDDRDTTTPTGTYWNTGRTTSDLAALAQQGWRFTDLEVESTSLGRFTVAAVRNTGDYAKSWWYYYNVSPSFVSSRLATNNARLIDLEVYQLNGETRMTAIMIRNAGADAKAWWWYHNATSSQVNSLVQQNNARLTNLERYTVNGAERFAAVMISNTGSDARAWGYYFGATLSTITNYMQQQNMRLYDSEDVGNGRYDAIMVRSPGQAWWHYYGASGSQVTAFLQQNVARAIDIERTVSRTGVRYNVVMLDNANALERRARSILFGGTDGATGVYLKEVGGPVLAAIQPDFVFEPASLLKTLYHAHAMRQVAIGSASLNEPIQVALGMNGSCPQGTGPFVTESLQTVLRRMMENSDNARTRAVAVRFGLPSINATADVLGMTRTDVNHTIGCGGPVPNELTLADVGRLHERVATGYLGAQRDTFYDLMPENLSFPTWGPRDLDDLIVAEATNLGLPASVRTAFTSQIAMAFKPGGYTVNGQQFHSEGGFLRVPFKNAQGTVTPREYVFGAFNHGATNLTDSRNAMSDAALEVVWDRVRAGLRSWDNFVPGTITAYGTACAGSGGILRHTGSGPATLGTTLQLILDNAANGATTVCNLGFSNRSWNGIRLPYRLPGTDCLLHVGIADSLTAIANSRGRAVVSLPIPNQPSLVGAHLYSQYLAVDGAANALGIATSNGIDVGFGGYR